jgi:hypothetical protein
VFGVKRYVNTRAVVETNSARPRPRPEVPRPRPRPEVPETKTETKTGGPETKTIVATKL